MITRPLIEGRRVMKIARFKKNRVERLNDQISMEYSWLPQYMESLHLRLLIQGKIELIRGIWRNFFYKSSISISFLPRCHRYHKSVKFTFSFSVIMETQLMSSKRMAQSIQKSLLYMTLLGPQFMQWALFVSFLQLVQWHGSFDMLLRKRYDYIQLLYDYNQQYSLSFEHIILTSRQIYLGYPWKFRL